MPVTNVGQITRFTSKIGATIPEPLLDALRSREADPDAVLQLGVAWATLQCGGAARGWRTRRALLHDESLARDARDPLGAARRAPLGSGSLSAASGLGQW